MERTPQNLRGGLGASWVAASAALVALAAPVPALGQVPDDGLREEVEEVRVIGSRIGRVYTTGGAPVSVFDRRDIVASGVASVGDFLQQLPGQGSAINTSRNNGGDGSVRVSFRNLGSARTLVLVNGRRWVNSGSGADASVDLNTIPLVMIERIEILKDGASAVYGSDAIAAVVNVVTRESIEGVHFAVRRGEQTAGGASVETYEVTFGSESDDGNTRFIVGASLDREGELSNADRPQTAAPPAGGGSPSTPQGSFWYTTGVDLVDENAGGLTEMFVETTTVSALEAETTGGRTTYKAAEGAAAPMKAPVQRTMNSNMVPIKLKFAEIGTGADAKWYPVQRHIVETTTTADDGTTSTTTVTHTQAEFLALSDSARLTFAASDGYRKEGQFDNDQWYNLAGSPLTPVDATDLTRGGTSMAVVTRPAPDALLNLIGEGSKMNSFGDSVRTCRTFTVTDGKGVSSDGDGSFYGQDTVANPGVSDGQTAFQENFRCWNSPADRYNFNPENFIRTPNERRSIFAIVSRDLYDGHRAKMEVSYQNRIGDRKLAPTPLVWGSNSGEFIAHNQAYNPFGLQICASPDRGGAACAHPDDLDNQGKLITYPTKTVWGFFGRRLLEVSNRFYTDDLESFRVAGTIEGAIDGNWDYTAFWQWSQNKSVTTVQGLVNTANLQNSLSGPDVCNRGCIPLNLFGGQGTDVRPGPILGTVLGSGSITREMIDYVSFVAQGSGGNTLKAYGFEVSGNVGSLAGGPIGLAAGLEIRGESGFFQPDSLVAAGLTSGNAAKPTSGSYEVTSLFAEAAFPWIETAAFSAETLVALRQSDYSTYGSNLTYKLTNRFALTERFIIRSTFSTGFRAPGVAELFAGRGDSYPQLNDPCDWTKGIFTGDKVTGAQAAGGRCAAEGVRDRFAQPDSQIRTTVGGNPGLQSEESDNLTLGVVFNLSDNLEISFDYYQVDITSTIDSLGPQSILNACYGADMLVVPDPETHCQHIDRGPTGLITDLRDFNRNTGSVETNGFDGTILWHNIETGIGTFDLSFDLYFLNKFFVTLVDGVSYEASGKVFGSARTNYVPQRIRAFLDWRYNAWDARLIWQHFAAGDGYANAPPSGAPDRTLAATLYMDGYLRYTFADLLGEGKNMHLTFGFANLLDQDPPFFPESFANDYNPDYRNWGSQSYYLRLSGNF